MCVYHEVHTVLLQVTTALLELSTPPSTGVLEARSVTTQVCRPAPIACPALEATTVTRRLRLTTPRSVTLGEWISKGSRQNR